MPPDRTLFPAAVWFMELLRDRVIFFDPDWDMLRSPAPPGMPRRLVPSGQNLPWLALDLQSSNEDEFASWIDHVRTALPQIRSIEAREREEDHYAYFSVEYEGGYRVTSSGLSDGTLRILAMTIIPFLPEEALPRLLVTEEPENDLHPQGDRDSTAVAQHPLYGIAGMGHDPLADRASRTRSCAMCSPPRLGGDGSVAVVPGDKHPKLRNWQGDSRPRHAVRGWGPQLNAAAKRDIVFLVPDQGIKQVLKGFLSREPHLRLGCGEFSIDSDEEILVSPTRDPGCLWQGPRTTQALCRFP